MTHTNTAYFIFNWSTKTNFVLQVP